MRGRVERLLGVPSGALSIGTFHGLAHRLLRIHWREANLVQSFQIIDSEDQQRLIKKLIRAAELDETRWIPREVQWFINGNKDEGRRPKHLKDGNDPTRMQLIRLYAAYEEACARAGAVDFAELLLRAYELWRDNPSLLDTTGGASAMCWWMSSRTPTASSTSGCGWSPPARPMRRVMRATRSLWAMTINRSTP